MTRRTYSSGNQGRVLSSPGRKCFTALDSATPPASTLSWGLSATLLHLQSSLPVGRVLRLDLDLAWPLLWWRLMGQPRSPSGRPCTGTRCRPTCLLMAGRSSWSGTSTPEDKARRQDPEHSHNKAQPNNTTRHGRKHTQSTTRKEEAAPSHPADTQGPPSKGAAT